MSESIAIIGLACCYPDASSPVEFWENILSKRRAFRRIPPERLRVEDYVSFEGLDERLTSIQAAVIEGYTFDRTQFRVAGPTFRTADLAHWLGLDIASRSLSDAGFPNGEGLPRESTGVLLGNTLTGEFSRANSLRLRWPYVRRILESRLTELEWSLEQRREFIESCEESFKEPFPEVTEETLAGSLSNTIAGRICNHFDLKGGGYTVDGACASSLLAVAAACSALVAGDLDVALAGGVDLSIDPFELIGFAKAGALATDKMRVFDRRSSGFFPGEGCGFAVLMRLSDAIEQRRRVYAAIKGWGVSSDGSGGITRPEVEGQLLALRRAYRRAGFGVESVTYFECHGTGTTVGDETELKVLAQARFESGKITLPAVVGSVKANIGHTKAAAGIAGLIKATLAIHNQIIPPTSGCDEPVEEITRAGGPLSVQSQGEVWPADRPLRAGVSAMGFGGVNTHIVVEGTDADRRISVTQRERVLLSTEQDSELFLLADVNRQALLSQVEHLLGFASRLSLAELTDLAYALQSIICQKGTASAVRAAFIASTPAQLVTGLESLRAWLLDQVNEKLDIRRGVFLGAGPSARVGFLFPGQASPVYLDGGIFARRFDFVASLYEDLRVSGSSPSATEVAQPAVLTASLAGLRLMKKLGITASVAVGHSLGEVTAIHWAGAFDEQAALRIGAARARALSSCNGVRGGMAGIRAGKTEIEALLGDEPLVVACVNSPRQTVVAGEETALTQFVDKVRAVGWTSVRLPVSHAFHSPLVASAASALASDLASEEFRPLSNRVISTVTGRLLTAHQGLRELLCKQILEPVRFADAVFEAAREVDIFIETGPGQALTGLVADCLDVPAVAIDAGGGSLKGLLKAAGAAFALGALGDPSALFVDRFTRPFKLDWKPRFFANPCELAPLPPEDHDAVANSRRQTSDGPKTSFPRISREPRFQMVERDGTAIIDLVRKLVAERAELPVESIQDTDRLLGDLHLNSINVSQLVVEAARSLGFPPPAAPTEFSRLTVSAVAEAIEEMRNSNSGRREGSPDRPGVDSWVRCFTEELVEEPIARNVSGSPPGDWRVFGSPEDLLTADLRRGFSAIGGRGIVLCLERNQNQQNMRLLLEAAHDVLEMGEGSRFVLVQRGRQGGAFARSLFLEAPWITVCVVNIPDNHPGSAGWVTQEASRADGYVEAHYDSLGVRRKPVLRLLHLDETTDQPFGPDDLIVVTGGGKGIVAECALAIARETGCRLLLLGRSVPEEDFELAANLARFQEHHVQVLYVAADVTDADSVRRAVARGQEELGNITAVLHGAGINLPRSLTTLDEASFHSAVAPKIEGARNLLEALDLEKLRWFISFGSLIARTGMTGEAHYGTANEWLAELAEEVQSRHPRCRCINIEWSAWSAVGMAERLGSLDNLRRQGISPISPEAGIGMLTRLLRAKTIPVSVVVTGRFGQPPTIEIRRPELPLLRFLESPAVYYPGIELIVESQISIPNDPYLLDHVIGGEHVLPGVIVLEAMAQAAMSLTGRDEPPVFKHVRFDYPVAVPQNSSVTIRLAALVRETDCVEVVLRSSTTGFQIDHCAAVCVFRSVPISEEPAVVTASEGEEMAIDPQVELYGRLLFHKGRFRRLRKYLKVTSTSCVAEVDDADQQGWFGPYLPSRLVLEDPARRDGLIHAVQVCVPDMTLLPVAVDEISIVDNATRGAARVFARQVARESDTFIYDVELKDYSGRLLERWSGLKLKVLGGSMFRGPWPPVLLGPYIERLVGEIGLSRVSVAVELSEAGGPSSTDRMIRRTVEEDVLVLRRPDGKPELLCDRNISASHCGKLIIAASSNGQLGCDVESILNRTPDTWRDLLGDERFRLAQLISEKSGEDADTAATRVWTAIECLKKAGATLDAPLTYLSSRDGGWVVLSSGQLSIATLFATVTGIGEQLIFAILIGSEGTGTSYLPKRLGEIRDARV